LQNVELFVLLKVIGQSVPAEVNGEEVTRIQTVRVSFNSPHVEKLGVAAFPDAKLMHREVRREGIPRLDQLHVREFTGLPAKGLDRKAEHRSSDAWFIESYLELEARCLLATDS